MPEGLKAKIEDLRTNRSKDQRGFEMSTNSQIDLLLKYNESLEARLKALEDRPKPGPGIRDSIVGQEVGGYDNTEHVDE